MTFVKEPDVMALIEELYVRLTERFSEKRMLKTPFPRFTYREAINRFGGERPDLHCGLEMRDVSDARRETGFRAFAQTLAMGGQVRVIIVPGCADYTLREIDELAGFATRAGANGLATFAVEADGIRSPVAEFLSEHEVAAMTADVGAQSVDLAVADMPPVVAKALSAVRDELGQRLSLADPNVLAFCWMYGSPLLEWNAEEGRWEATQNPFSGLLQEGGSLLETHPADVRAKQYDLVGIGNELNGGSIRNHRRSDQQRLFELMEYSPEETATRFGALLDALECGRLLTAALPRGLTTT